MTERKRRFFIEIVFFFSFRKPLPDPEVGRHHVNELDRLRRQMREKDLAEMCRKLEHLKSHAKSSKEIIQSLEDVKESLDYLQADVNESFSFPSFDIFTVNKCFFSLKTVFLM